MERPALPQPDARKALEKGIETFLSDISVSCDSERKALLEQKQLLSARMEELRATMRHVQEDSEQSSDEARRMEAEAALELCKVVALRLAVSFSYLFIAFRCISMHFESFRGLLL